MQNINYCIMGIVVCFIIWIFLFLIFKPDCVCQINNNTNVKIIYWPLVIFYSLLLSIPIGLIILWGIKDNSSFSFQSENSEIIFI